MQPITITPYFVERVSSCFKCRFVHRLGRKNAAGFSYVCALRSDIALDEYKTEFSLVPIKCPLREGPMVFELDPEVLEEG